jgi:intermembrane space import and assembly protein 40
MSVCKDFGKDKVMFVTKEDHSTPSTVQLAPAEPAPGLILPSGDINWNCPCLGGMATGPCGVEFRDAFSCFHYSEENPKGSDCYDTFKTMQECFSKYPTVYNKSGDDDNDDLDEVLNVSSATDIDTDSVDQIDEPKETEQKKPQQSSKQISAK